MDRLIRSIMGPIARLYGWLLGLVCDPGPVFSRTYYPWVTELESHWSEIRREMDQVQQASELPSFDQVVAGEAGIADYRWKIFMFRLYSTTDIEENCARCPRTYQLIRDLPGITTAWFSILEPGKHIRAHRGPFRGVLRCLLPVKVPGPAGSCRIRIADQVHVFEEGKCLIFDDTFEHEVWNDSEGERGVLFLDVKRPMPAPFRWLNDLVLWLIGLIVVPRLADRARAVPAARSDATGSMPPEIAARPDHVAR